MMEECSATGVLAPRLAERHSFVSERGLMDVKQGRAELWYMLPAIAAHALSFSPLICPLIDGGFNQGSLFLAV